MKYFIFLIIVILLTACHHDNNSASNNSPTVSITASSDVIAEGLSVTLTAAANDLDNDAISFKWEVVTPQGVNVNFSDVNNTVTTFIAPEVNQDTTITIQVIVSDGKASTSDVINITILEVNTTPINTAPEAFITSSHIVIFEGETVSVSGANSFDMEGDSLNYTWSQIDNSQIVISFDKINAENTTFIAPSVESDTIITIQLEVNDGTFSDTETMDITIQNIVNSPPTINGLDDQEVNPNTLVTLNAMLADADGDNMVVNWQQVDNTGINIALSNTDSETTSFTAPAVNQTTILQFEITVTDGIDTVNQTVNIIILADIIINTSNHRIYLPSSITVDEGISGDIDGAAIFVEEDRDFVGFVAERPVFNNELDVQEFFETIAENLLTDANSFKDELTNVGTQRIDNNGLIANFNLALNTASMPTELASRLASVIGINQQGGSVNFITSSAKETLYTEYTIDLVLAYYNTNDAVILLSIVPINNSDFIEITNASMSPSNISPTINSPLQSDNNTFTATSDTPLADFLFVVDNSSSMYDNQQALSQATEDFIEVIENTGVDYRLATITTDSIILQDSNGDGGFTTDIKEFQTDIMVGINGSNNESGIYQAEQALLAGGSIINAGYPREQANFSIIIFSDEYDQYFAYTGTAFNAYNNIFIDNSYRVYCIINTELNYYDNNYDDLCNATGGLIADITDVILFPQIMNNIAIDAGAVSSVYLLAKMPVVTTIEVIIDGNVIAHSHKNGWLYNASNNAIIFYGSTVPVVGANIIINYLYF